MEVVLAGYNVDAELLEAIKEGRAFDPFSLTPETISAAYARISRSEKSATELRKESLSDVPRARASNQKIVFGMSHHSVAEHAYFNFDVIGVSRLALEWLEESRLCSFTEKSQRYVNFERSDYVIPPEIHNTSQVEELIHLEEKKLSLYNKATKRLKKIFSGKKERAEEDARYILGLATESQVGFSANARNLEYLIRKLNAHPLAEGRELGEKLYAEARRIAPSLIIMADAREFKETTGAELKEDFLKSGLQDCCQAVAEALSAFQESSFPFSQPLPKVWCSGGASRIDEEVLASTVFRHGSLPYREARSLVLRINENERKKFFLDCLKSLSQYDALPREFETVWFKFEAVISASCYAQLKRHRICTQLVQPYSPEFGYVIPETVKTVRLEGDFENLMNRSSEFGEKLKKIRPGLEAYAYTNGHQRRVLLVANARELYHIARLRMDKHAQWEIQEVAGRMVEEARKIAPITMLLACGKDQFEGLKKKIYKSP